MVRYQRVVWHHDFDSEPQILISEIVAGREVRKVEKFRDGRSQYAGPDGSTGDTVLSETLMPLASEISQDPQFSLEPISAEGFEREWQAAVGGSP